MLLENTSLGQVSQNASGHFFDNVYKKDWSMALGITVSFVNILFLTPLLYFIIWHEKYGSDQYRFVEINYGTHIMPFFVFSKKYEIFYKIKIFVFYSIVPA
jgi:hypothetical protein